jgi:uncharacterized protein (DUF2236 family)
MEASGRATVKSSPPPSRRAPLIPVVEPLRGWMGGRIRLLLAGEPSPPAGFDRPPGDAGLFGPGSATWQVHGNLAMLVGGLRSLLLQTLHPLAMAGVAQHSDYRRDPWGRLHRTAHFVAATTYGSTAEAERAIAQVRRIHRHVRGVSSEGVPYRADDPALLAWVHATEVDSFWRAYRRYGGSGPGAAASRVPRSDADRYVAEMAELGRRLGVTEPPTTAEELRAYLESMRPELRATPEARDAVRFLLNPPAPLATRPAYLVVAGAAVGLLPGFIRRELRLPLPLGIEPLVVRPAARTLLDLLGWALGPPPPR